MTKSIRSKDSRALRSLAALKAALLDLLQCKNFDEITIKEIAEGAGVGPATFYRHYVDKAALLDEIAQTEIENLVAMALPMLDQAVSERSTLALIDYVDERRHLWRALLDGGAAGVMRAGFMRRLSQAFDGSTPVAGWVPPELGIVFAVSATVEIIAWWLRQEKGVSKELIADYLDGLAIQPTLRRPNVAEQSRPTELRFKIDATIRLEPNSG
jgi:AcrR family transcriptional regulator